MFFREPPVHPRCLCVGPEQGSSRRKSGKAEYLKEAMERYYTSIGSKSMPCECMACYVLYNGRGIASLYTEATCPRRAKLTWKGLESLINDPALKGAPHVAPLAEALSFSTTVASLVTRKYAYSGFDQLGKAIKGIAEYQEEYTGSWKGLESLINDSATNTSTHKDTSMTPGNWCGLAACSICNPARPKAQGEFMSISNSASSLADEVRRLGRDHNTDLSVISSAIAKAEAERKEIIVSALRSMAKLEKAKNRREGKAFFIVYQYEGDEYIVHGVDYGYGEDIKDSEICKAHRVFLNEPVGINYEYWTMDRFKKSLENSGIPYVIEYLD